MDSKNSLSNKIEKYYDQYVDRQKNIGVNKRHYSILQKITASDLKKYHSVLEIGCGIGTFTGLLIEYLSKGNLLAMDISALNIQEANRKLGNHSNLSLIHADAVKYNFGTALYDVVVLPDVIEHIPIETHFELFRKISEVLTPNGFVFIHIPNPYYLEWCINHRTDLLQIVDQPIHTNILIENTLPNNLVIKKIETYSIWVKDGDYQFIVLQKKGHEDFTKQIEERITLIDKVKYKLNVKRN